MSRLIEAKRLPIAVTSIPGTYDYGKKRAMVVATQFATDRNLPEPVWVEAEDNPHTSERYLVIAGTAVGDKVREEWGLDAEEKFFGGWGKFNFIVDKGILHPLPQGAHNHPEGFLSDTGQALYEAGAVVPGVTAFEKKDAYNGAAELFEEFDELLIKSADGSNKERQWGANTLKGAMRAIGRVKEETLATRGVIIEAKLKNPETFHVGVENIGGEIFSYVGDQVLTKRRTKEGKLVEAYGGATLYVARGELSTLLELPLSEAQEEAVRQTSFVHTSLHNDYGSDKLLTPRALYDIVRGEVTDRKTQQKKIISGVVDPSYRLGGSSMALAPAQGLLLGDESIGIVEARAITDYGYNEWPGNTTTVFETVDTTYGAMRFGVLLNPLRQAT